MPKTKIIIISISVIIAALIGFLVVYNFFLKEKTQPIEEKKGQLPEIPDKKNGLLDNGSILPKNSLTALSQNQTISPIIISQNNTVRYFQPNGNIVDISLDNNDPKFFSSDNIPDFIKSLWSPNGKETINITNSNSIKKTYVNYTDNITTALSPSITGIAWSPDGKKIAYQYNNTFTNNNNISIANPDGSNFSNIINTRVPNWQIAWSKDDIISLLNPPTGLAEGVLYKLNPQTKALTKIISDLNGLNVLWSPDGSKILYSYTDSKGFNLKLAVTDNSGNNTLILDAKTLTDKCAWSFDNKNVYCGIPSFIPQQTVLPDSYYSNEISFNDSIVKINTETGDIKTIFKSSDPSLDVVNLLLSANEDFLIFINKHNGYLYSLTLN